MSKEAMKLALAALEVATTPLARDRQEVLRAIAALREALAEQPAQQEPVAAECKFDTESMWYPCEIEHHNLVQSEPHKWPQYQTRLLYTTPPQRKPLTDEEIESINVKFAGSRDLARLFARAIEAAQTRGEHE